MTRAMILFVLCVFLLGMYTNSDAAGYMAADNNMKIVQQCATEAKVAYKLQRNRQERGMTLHDAQIEIAKATSKRPNATDIDSTHELARNVFAMPFYRDKDWVTAIIRDWCYQRNGIRLSVDIDFEMLAKRAEMDAGYR